MEYVMTVNTFLTSGEVQRIDVNNKPTKKGPAAVIVVQYGDSRQRTDQAVQFLNIALIRLPPYVYEKCKDQLKLGAWVDVVGHVQGVLKPMVSEGFVTNELVADRVTIADAGEPEETAAAPAAEQSEAAA
jgi:hypothetical protein